ncbi:hypothetical protein OAA86_08165 [Rhodospirillales bacterium]|nr:hypothetical protein [Rhodospirillales bacterium]
MTEVTFPQYVEEFIQMIKESLSHFDMKLAFKEENAETKIRSYELVGSSFKTTLFVHRTQRSFDHEIAEYRARMWTEISPNIGDLLKGKDAVLNRFSTLGALVSNETSADVGAQCIIDEKHTATLAGIAAASMAQAGQSLIHSVGSKSFPDIVGENAVHEMSAWGDLDFEQIQYDYAHFGTATHSNKEWSIKLGFRHTLTLTAVQNNPFYGGGLLCLLWVPRSEFGEGDNILPIKNLNSVENLFGEAPTFGGWCDDGDKYVFTSFFPNYLKQMAGLTDNLINWAVVRSKTVDQLVELSASIGHE